jgi:Family of unknown function (DUF5847)
MSKNNNNEILVNGPINAFRLEGKINDINKVIYLFGDFHHPINVETKCDSYVSDDFIKYYHKTMKKTNSDITYDFLFENYSDIDMFEQYRYSYSPYRKQYINEIRSYVDSDMEIYETKKNISDLLLENKGSKTFKNVRLHYLDIRSFYRYYQISSLLNGLDNLISQYDSTQHTYYIIKNLISTFINIKNELKYLINKLSIYSKNKPKQLSDIILPEIKDKEILDNISKYKEDISSHDSRINKYLEKIFKRDKHAFIKNKLMASKIFKLIFTDAKEVISIINGCLRKLLILYEIGNVNDFSLNKMYDEGYRYGIDYYKTQKLLSQIKIKVISIHDKIIPIYTKMTDLYCLRRILAKDYINHAIVYTGAAHTINYAVTLVQNFDFNITHAEYTKFSLDETNNLIKNKKMDNYDELFYKPIFKQCTDMAKFPDKFL